MADAADAASAPVVADACDAACASRDTGARDGGPASLADASSSTISAELVATL